MMTTDYQTPTSPEPRLERARRFWRAAFIGTLVFLLFFAVFCWLLMAGWWVPPQSVMRYF